MRRKKQRKMALDVLEKASDVFQSWAALDDALADKADAYSHWYCVQAQEALVRAVTDCQAALGELTTSMSESVTEMVARNDEDDTDYRGLSARYGFDDD